MSSTTLAATEVIPPLMVKNVIMRELQRQSPAAGGLPPLAIDGDVIVIGKPAPASPGAIVVAAIDDDRNPASILRYAATQARRLTVPLRLVHVWSPFGRSEGPGVRMVRHDRMSDADYLLAEVLYGCLPETEATMVTERQILYNRDPVSALLTLSTEAALVVLGVRGGETRDDVIGATVRGLLGRTACPLALIPDPTSAAHAGGW